MTRQNTFTLTAKKRGSCALSLNENADPDVRSDMAAVLDHMVKENEPYYNHTYKGVDDMPVRAKCSLFGVILKIPAHARNMAGNLSLRVQKPWRGEEDCSDSL